MLASCDIVVHSAAAVSFDEPLDRAAEVNLMGPVRLVATLHELEVQPHLVAVSTCYVAGSRKGDAPEEALTDGPFYVPIDWRAETEAARRTRAYVEDDSRRIDRARRVPESTPAPSSGPPAPRPSPGRPSRSANAG